LCCGTARLAGAEEDKIASPAEDPALFIGMTLQELYALYGVPQSVHPVRGREEWQDDVVFTYGNGDFYIYRDRIWQVGVQNAYGIKIGDNQAALAETLGERITLSGAHALYSLPDRRWSITVRFNMDPKGAVSAIFIYRSDF
jgi:hypothetical protein